MPTVVAIDGPAASGKSSVALGVARRLGFRYVNSGAIYRAITWHILESGADPDDPAAVEASLASARIECRFANDESTIRIDGRNPEPFLRDAGVNRSVSRVSNVAGVRRAVGRELARLAQSSTGVVVEGRDIGSVVFKDTPYKFYLDAAPDIRAARRVAQGQHDEIAARDRFDSSRAAAPLVVAADAQVIDTSALTIDGVVEEVLRRLQALGLPGKPAQNPSPAQ